jgi:peroxiredoxin
MQETLIREIKILDRTLQQAELVGKPAAAFSLTDLNGQKHNLAKFRGRVLLLTFFASWCGPCNDEAPQIETQFWQRWRPRGLMVLGIDGREEGDALIKSRGFRDKHKLTYPLLIDTEGKATAAYHVQASPVNVVIDRDGIVSYVSTGFNSDALKAVLTPLLKP